MGVSAKDFPNASLAPETRREVWRLGFIAMAVAILSNGIPTYFILSMLKHPRGSSVRPTLEAASIVLGAMFGIAAVVLAARCAFRSYNWRVGWVLAAIAFLLGAAPWPVGRLLFDWVVAERGLALQP